MKEVQKTIFVCFDGKEFSTRAEAAAWEDQHVDARLVGLSIEQVREALSYRDKELATAVEYAGDLRRRPVKVIAPNGGDAAGAAGETAGDGE